MILGGKMNIKIVETDLKLGGTVNNRNHGLGINYNYHGSHAVMTLYTDRSIISKEVNKHNIFINEELLEDESQTWEYYISHDGQISAIYPCTQLENNSVYIGEFVEFNSHGDDIYLVEYGYLYFGAVVGIMITYTNDIFVQTATWVNRHGEELFELGFDSLINGRLKESERMQLTLEYGIDVKDWKECGYK